MTNLEKITTGYYYQYPDGNSMVFIPRNFLAVYDNAQKQFYLVTKPDHLEIIRHIEQLLEDLASVGLAKKIEFSEDSLKSYVHLGFNEKSELAFREAVKLATNIIDEIEYSHGSNDNIDEEQNI